MVTERLWLGPKLSPASEVVLEYFVEIFACASTELQFKAEGGRWNRLREDGLVQRVSICENAFRESIDLCPRCLHKEERQTSSTGSKPLDVADACKHITLFGKSLTFRANGRIDHQLAPESRELPVISSDHKIEFLIRAQIVFNGVNLSSPRAWMFVSTFGPTQFINEDKTDITLDVAYRYENVFFPLCFLCTASFSFNNGQCSYCNSHGSALWDIQV
jgi:hypothetical protein